MGLAPHLCLYPLVPVRYASVIVRHWFTSCHLSCESQNLGEKLCPDEHITFETDLKYFF